MPFTIRLFAYSAVSCLLLAGTARAEIDFTVLLAQLPNLESEADGDDLLDPGVEAAQVVSDEEISAPVGEAPSNNPADFLAPSDDDLLSSDDISAPPVDEPQENLGRTLGGPPADLDLPADLNNAPALKPYTVSPYTGAAPQSQASPHSIVEEAEASIDFQQMFEAQNSQPTDVAMGQGYTMAAPHCGCTGPQHYCQPHRRPSLPPPVTMESMYHCKPCYRDVWAGYEADRQKECDKLHKHLHGRCDCLKPDCDTCCPTPCDDGSCDDGSCVQSPSFFSRLFHN